MPAVSREPNMNLMPVFKKQYQLWTRMPEDTYKLEEFDNVYELYERVRNLDYKDWYFTRRFNIELYVFDEKERPGYSNY